MSELSENDRAEIWSLQTKHGWNFEQAKKEWLEMKQLTAKPRVEEPEPESDPFEGEESQEEEYQDLRLENERRKSKLLDEIEDDLDKESIEEAKTIGQDAILETFWNSFDNGAKESCLWFLDKLAELTKKKGKSLIVRVQIVDDRASCVAQYVNSEGLPKPSELVDE